MAFKQVGPGIFINTDRVTFSIPHPDTCFVIRSKDDRRMLSDGDSMPIFSEMSKLERFMSVTQISPNEFKSVEMSWDELVDRYTQAGIKEVVLDHEGVAGFYENIPLRKDI